MKSILALSALLSLVAAQNDGSSPAYPTPSDTISDCTYYVNVQSGNTCASIESYYSLCPRQFRQLYNPSIKSDCSGLKVGESYCVEENFGNQAGQCSTTVTPTTTTKPTTTTSPTPTGPSPVQSGIASNCNRYYKVVSGDTCQGIVDKYGTFTLQQFYGWNPAVKSDCTGLQADDYVCIGVPGTPTTRPTSTKPTSSGPLPEQTGITSDCKRYYKVVSGDTCQAIVNKYGTFTLQQFYKWNPAVGSSCQTLQVGYYVCIGVTGTPTVKPTSTTPKPTNACPTPQQSGTIATCKKCYRVASGDTCAKIEKAKGISAQNFAKWNPGVNSQCTNLGLGNNICIGV